MRKYKRHGLRHTKAYEVWANMLARCNNPKNIGYKNYGGRVIRVCEQWHDFENFYSDMGNPPKGMFLERVNNNKNYSPSNCEWVSRKVQTRNKRSNVTAKIAGQTKSLAEWCDILGLSNKELYRLRYKKKLSPLESIKWALGNKALKEYKYGLR